MSLLCCHVKATSGFTLKDYMLRNYGLRKHLCGCKTLKKKTPLDKLKTSLFVLVYEKSTF